LGEFYWRRDGTRFPAECWAHPLLQPIGPTEFVLTFQDLTESHQDKEALRLSQDKFRRVLANAPDVAWTSDRNGRVVYISPKVDAMLGYTTEEIRASGANLWLGLIHPEDFGRVNLAYRALFENHVPFNEEYRIRRRDGIWIWVQDRSMGTHVVPRTLPCDASSLRTSAAWAAPPDKRRLRGKGRDQNRRWR
jgi:PAS domain S-box-containing protein